MDAFNTILTYLQDPETPLGMLDPVYGTFIVYGLVRGLFLGLPEEVARVVGTFLVVFGSRIFYQPVSEALIDRTQLESEQVSFALAYLLLALLFFVVWRLLILITRKALDWTFPDLTHRPGGAIVGFAKSTLILCVVLTIVQLTSVAGLQKHMIDRSWIGRTLSPFLPKTLEELPQDWLPGSEVPDTPPAPVEDGSGDA